LTYNDQNGRAVLMEQIAELNKIVHDVLGTKASEYLLKSVCAILEEGHKDSASLKQACTKIEKMVALFIDSASAQKLADSFSKALD
jgi:hypothetical protein